MCCYYYSRTHIHEGEGGGAHIHANVGRFFFFFAIFSAFYFRYFFCDDRVFANFFVDLFERVTEPIPTNGRLSNSALLLSRTIDKQQINQPFLTFGGKTQLDSNPFLLFYNLPPTKAHPGGRFFFCFRKITTSRSDLSCFRWTWT